MPSSWRPVRIERAKPLLGTIVSIRADFDDGGAGEAAVRAAFADIAKLHQLMSFQSPDSDLSRIGREGVAGPVRIDGRTAEVLAFALDLATVSGGVFDPVTAARTAVDRGVLPRPEAARQAAPDSRWSDVELRGDQVRLRRPAWIDLGGVAKGYAVDRAISLLAAGGARQGSVNAGGDLRVFGPEAETVRLRAPGPDEALIELQEAALASSGWAGEGAGALHLDGDSGRIVHPQRFASVIARDCMTADALSKVVLARGEAAEPLLCARQAQAHLFDPASSWRRLGGPA